MSLFSPAIFFVDTAAITFDADDGDAAPSSGTTTATHTYNTQTSTGPHTIVAVSWDIETSTLSSATWNGSAITIIGQVNSATATRSGAFLYAAGARTGTLVLNFSGSVDNSEITKMSISNLQSATAVDTDTNADDNGGGLGGALPLAALATPGVGGIRIVVYNNANIGTVAWTNGTEIADISVGVGRHAVAYDLGDDSGTITPDGGGNACVAYGISLR